MSVSHSSSRPVDTIVCLYCRAFVAFSGLPATRYSDHLRNEHNILVPDELQFSISRTLKKTFEKKAGVSRIKLQSFSEASRLDESMNIADLHDNADEVIESMNIADIHDNADEVNESMNIADLHENTDQDFNRNKIISEKETVSQQDQNSIPLNPFNDEEQLFERGQIVDNVHNLNNFQNENQCKVEIKEGIVDYKSSEDEEGNLLPKIFQLNVPDCYVKLEKLQLSTSRTKLKVKQRKKRPAPAPDPPEVPWYEFKMYTCLLCHVDVFLGSVDRHLSIVHNSDVTRYLVMFPHEDVLLSIPMWSCEDCGEETPWMHRTITHHLQVKHNHMDINQYYFKYVLKIKKEDKSFAAPVVNEGESKEMPSCVKIEVPDQDEITEDGDKVSVPLKLPWYESSWHRCHICQEIFTFGYFVKTHIKKVHGMTQAKYFSQNPGASTKVADWNCQICGKKIKWMNDSIYRHLRFGHRMSKIEYQQNYLEDQESVNGNVTDETITGDDGLENDEIELPGVPETCDASSVINSKVLNPFHSPRPNVQNDKLETHVQPKNSAEIRNV